MRAKRHQHRELLAILANEIDERPWNHRVAAPAVQKEIDLLDLTDCAEVIVKDTNHVFGDSQIHEPAVSREIRDYATVPQLLERRDLRDAPCLRHAAAEPALPRM